MKCRIEVSKKAEKFLKNTKLDKFIRNSVYEKILMLGDQPLPHGVKKLKAGNFYRIRHGDYRIIYEIKNKVLVIVVINIAHRKDTYK